VPASATGSSSATSITELLVLVRSTGPGTGCRILYNTNSGTSGRTSAGTRLPSTS
jgi:hypothetical protein